MVEKICNRCETTKNICEFRKKRNQCKQCEAEYNKKWREKNNNYFVAYRKENKEKRNEYNKTWREQNRESSREYHRKWADENKENIKVLRRERDRKRRQDINYRIQSNVSRLVRRAIKKVSNGNAIKGGSTFEHLPYTPQQLKEHIENQFEDWMNWDNWGKWHIDHITPQSALLYDSLKHPNFQKCWALENLCPLSAEDNIYKSNKY